MTRETVGKIAVDLMAKEPETKDPIEQMREQLSEYEKNFYECLAAHKSVFPGDFYIVVLTKKEPLMQNVLRNYFMARQSCPTPDYDQAVYRYIRADERIDFLWIIPSRDTCKLFKKNALQIHPTERELLNFVLAFADGSLFKLCKELNGEKDNSPELIKK